MLFDVREFGATAAPGVDDTAAVQASIDAARKAGGGVVLLKAGTYEVGDLNSYANVQIRGEGWGTKLKKRPGASHILSVNRGTSEATTPGSADPSGNAGNVSIQDVWFEGLSASGFTEHKHCLNLSAVSDAIIRRCKFSSFEGDAIYLGSSNAGNRTVERHNERVTILECHFDGVNKENRNAISIIDGSDIWIRGCYFTRCSKATMPGAIDMEPDSAFNRIRNINIMDCVFVDIGGGVGCIVLTLGVAQDAMKVPAAFINISNVRIDGCAADYLVFTQVEQKKDASIANDITVQSVTAIGGRNRAFQLNGVKGVKISDSHFNGSESEPLIGYTHACQDIHFERVDFEGIAAKSQGGVTLGASDRVEFSRCRFVDCGNGRGYGIHLAAGGSTSNMLLDRCHWLNPRSRMYAAVFAESSHRMLGQNVSNYSEFGGLIMNAPMIGDFSGAGSPEGLVTAAVGARYRRTDGGMSTTIYVKESGTGPAGWVAK